MIRDLTGQTFGKWFVKSLSPNKYQTGKDGSKAVFNCLCECGTEREVIGNNLLRGISTSCGCSSRKYKEIKVGDIFHCLTVIKYLGVRNRNSAYLCKCKCNNLVSVAGASLNNGNTKSCGCYRIEQLRKKCITDGISKTKEYRRLQASYKRATKLNRTPLWLTDWDKQYIKEMYLYCPKGFEIDHIIPLHGKLVSGLHVPENLQYLYKPIHTHKSNTFTPYTQLIENKDIFQNANTRLPSLWLYPFE